MNEVGDEGDSKLVAASKVIAQAEWERLRKGPLRWEQISFEAREVLESVAMKGLCVGLLMNSLPREHAEQQSS